MPLSGYTILEAEIVRPRNVFSTLCWLLASKPATMTLRVLKRPSLPANSNAKGIEP